MEVSFESHRVLHSGCWGSSTTRNLALTGYGGSLAVNSFMITEDNENSRRTYGEIWHSIERSEQQKGISNWIF